tara:strand:+ start:84 stop:281 length:198 start_codon:yes stop_codon:yes gene_type:complete
MVKLRTVPKNKINNILKAEGVPMKKESMSSEESLQKIEQINFDSITQVEIRNMVNEIRCLNKSIT